ncbi:MAG: DnaD domain protein [Clostridia bacterium]|nr:DnaD domain protein [Clostridia bacterium]
MFRIKEPNLDFGHTAIENIFINDFMPMANGVQLKVYLTGFKFAKENPTTRDVTNVTIAKHLNIPLSDVLSAWDFWENKNVIIKHPKKDATDVTDFDVEFLSLIQLYIDKNLESKQVASTVVAPSQTAEMVNASQDPQIKEMFYLIDQLMRRNLQPNERMRILDWIRTYNFDTNLVVRAFELAIEGRGQKNFNYVKSILLSWYDSGLLTLQDVEDKLLLEKEEFLRYRKIYAVLGYSSKLPSEGDKEVMGRWLNDYQFDFDFLIFVLKESSKRTSNVNMNYLDKIVIDLYKENVHDMEAYKTYIAERQPKERNSETVQPSKKAGNRFHNFEQKTEKYTNDELEKILGIRK